jgi:lysophospholipase L1-like esterase
MTNRVIPGPQGLINDTTGEFRGVRTGDVDYLLPVFARDPVTKEITAMAGPRNEPIININEYFNFTSLNLANWRKVLAKVRAGTANAKLAFIGDSTTASWYGVTDTTVRSKAYPNQCASIMAGLGITTGVQSFWGNNRLNNSTSLAAFDSRAAMGAWTIELFSNAIGGSFLKGAAGTAFSWTPAVQVDTFDIYYINGSFNANIDGGANTANTPGGVNVKKMTMTAALGTHTLNLTYVSGTVYVMGVDAYNSAVKQVSCWNWGYYGSDTTNWVTSTNLYDAVPAITFMAPDLSIIDLTINDIGNSVPVATAKTNLQTVINTCRLSGDVILNVPVPGQISGGRTQAVIDSFASMIYDVAIANDCPMVSFNRRWVNYTSSNALGFMADALHPSTIGYVDKGQALSNVLSRI